VGERLRIVSERHLGHRIVILRRERQRARGVQKGPPIRHRAVQLSPKDRLLAVPYSLILRETLVNTSQSAWKELSLPISVPGTVDIAPVENEILRSRAKLRFRLGRRFPPVLATKVRTAQSTDLVLTIMIRRSEERDALLLEVNTRVHEAIQGSRGKVGPTTSPTAEGSPSHRSGRVGPALDSSLQALQFRPGQTYK